MGFTNFPAGNAGSSLQLAQSGLVYITSSSFSAAASVSVNGCFTATYENYRVILRCTNSTTAAVNIRMRASSSDDSSANYLIQEIYGSGSTVATAVTSGATSGVVISSSLAGTNTATIDVFSPAVASPTVMSALASKNVLSTAYALFDVSSHNVSTAYDGFSLLASAGTITGTLRVYGYRNS